jgi:glycine C-acetyltransferase
MIVNAGIRMFDMMTATNKLQEALHRNTKYFFEKMSSAGFDIKPTESAIVPIMLYDAQLSQDFASALLDEGIYVIGFYYPVVPQGQARIRVQLSAAHTMEHLDQAIDAFVRIGRKMNVI